MWSICNNENFWKYVFKNWYMLFKLKWKYLKRIIKERCLDKSFFSVFSNRLFERE